MNEYVVLAVKVGDDPTVPADDKMKWYVGTRQSAGDRAQELESQGYHVSIRGCTHILNIEFFRAGLNYKGEPA